LRAPRGLVLNFSDIAIEPFVPAEYLTAKNPNELITMLKKADPVFSKRVAEAKSKGNVLRYVASLEVKNKKPILQVQLKELPKDRPLGVLSGTGNKIVVVTAQNYSAEKPYIVEAPGAGPAVTAPQNIRRRDLFGATERKKN